MWHKEFYFGENHQLKVLIPCRVFFLLHCALCQYNAVATRNLGLLESLPNDLGNSFQQWQYIYIYNYIHKKSRQDSRSCWKCPRKIAGLDSRCVCYVQSTIIPYYTCRVYKHLQFSCNQRWFFIYLLGIQGAESRACLKRSRTREAPTLASKERYLPGNESISHLGEKENHRLKSTF